MDYLNGVRLTSHYHELSPLDAAIANFERQAKHFHRQRKSTTGQPETPEQRKQREDELAKSLKHLQHERRLALATAAVQVQLEAYRSALHTKNADSRAQRSQYRDAMRAERHHPTYILGKFLRADGRPQPGPNHTAHHIIPGKGKSFMAVQTRINLHLCDIRINDPVNGVWLVRRRKDKGHWSMPNANSHSEIHTKNYEKWVHMNTLATDEQGMRANLLRLRLILEAGTQPPKVTLPPDDNWNGHE